MVQIVNFFFVQDGHCPVIVPALNVYLTDKLPAFVSVQDASLEVIALLRILHAFNRYWATVYEVIGVFFFSVKNNCGAQNAG